MHECQDVVVGDWCETFCKARLSHRIQTLLLPMGAKIKGGTGAIKELDIVGFGYHYHIILIAAGKD